MVIGKSSTFTSQSAHWTLVANGSTRIATLLAMANVGGASVGGGGASAVGQKQRENRRGTTKTQNTRAHTNTAAAAAADNRY